MDEGYQRAAYNSDVYSRQQQQQQHSYQPQHNHNQRYQRRPVGTSSSPQNYHTNLYRKVSGSSTTTTTSATSYLTGQNVGIVIAVLVIYLFSRKDGFGRLFSARQERGGTLNLLMDCYLEIQDYFVAFAHAAIELCRSLGLHSLGNWLEDWCPLHDDDMMTTTSPGGGGAGGGVRNSSALHQSPNGGGGTAGGGVGGGGGRGRRRNMMGMTPSGGGGGGRMASNRMPELEETDVNKLQAFQQQGETTTTKIINGPLEPAFLRDEDYPAGWLVFDPTLGVVSKVEADKYRLELMKQQKKQYLEDQEAAAVQQQHQQQKQSTLPHQSPAAKHPATTRRPDTAVPQQQRKQQQQPQTPTQYKSNSTNNNNKSNQARPIRSTTNVIPNPSATMHTPQTIGVNG